MGMNPETGHFVDTRDLDPLRGHEDWPRFAIGEQVEIKGYQFQIVSVNTQSHTLTLRSWRLAMEEKIERDRTSPLETSERQGK